MVRVYDVKCDKSKNIVVCCDGTGQKLDGARTNVVRLFLALDRSDPDEQVAYYDPGVGTMPAAAALTLVSRQLTRWAGLIAGFGVLDDVAKAYGFIVDRYKPGDRIYLVGFSRGALTARIIGGLLHRIGVLRSEARNLIPYALELHGKHLTHIYDKNERCEARAVIEEFRKNFSVNGRGVIHFLGVWDTVKAFGVFRPKSFPHLRHNPSVKTVRHAIALHERRASYMFTSWGGLCGSVEANSHPDQDVKEVWFAGDHSDVGGGYREEESGLSWRSLRWMVGEACVAGLKFCDAHSATTPSRHLAERDCFYKCHTMTKLWWLLDLVPRFELENAPPGSPLEEDDDELSVPLGWPKRKFTLWPDGTRFPADYRRKGQDDLLLHCSVKPLVEAGKYKLNRVSYVKDAPLFAPPFEL